MGKFPKTYISALAWRSVEPLNMQALVPLLRDGNYAYFPQIGDALVERARGMSATHFLRHTDAEVHLSIDSDITGFEKDQIDLMVEQAMEYSIVGAVYICRSTARTFPATFFEDEQSIEFAVDPTPQPVRWSATGCLAVHRRVFEKMVDQFEMPLLHQSDGLRAYYDFYDTMQYDAGGDVGLIKLSEDYAFSERARQAGFTSYVNPAVRLGHIGPYIHRLEDMAQTPLKPQPVRLTHIGRHWRIECAGEEESPEALGRIGADFTPELKERFDKVTASV